MLTSRSSLGVGAGAMHSASAPLTPAMVREYEAPGVDELVIPPLPFEGAVDEALERNAEFAS